MSKRPNLTTLRRRVYERDEGICWGCGMEVEWGNYQLGHIVDRHMGGSDTVDNLAVMCSPCNRFKPSHSTKAEASQWQKQQGFLGTCMDIFSLASENHREIIESLSVEDVQEWQNNITKMLKALKNVKNQTQTSPHGAS